MKYLDPKNDLIFKRVFGENPNITISFLNSLLPLKAGNEIVEIEYLPTELVPESTMVVKNSIVDVRCKDKHGRQFIVEMQMIWTDSFKSRVLFNASKAYIRQLYKGSEYKGLQTVYALSIVNEDFELGMEEWYHHYSMIHQKDPNRRIEGIQMIFIELPKFNSKNYNDKKLTILWLRYLSEINKLITMLDQKMSLPEEILQAIELTKESYYTPQELAAYDRYWDTISTEKSLIADAENRGRHEGREEGREEGKEEGRIEGAIIAAKKLKDLGVLTFAQIANVTGLSESEIEVL